MHPVVLIIRQLAPTADGIKYGIKYMLAQL
jgi:hypothetical protein